MLLGGQRILIMDVLEIASTYLKYIVQADYLYGVNNWPKEVA